MVAVRMVSEGVDVPRLAVGVYATTTSTPLFFAQAVGRFVRARDRGETASVFLPSVPNLLGYAAELELQRDHVLGRRDHRRGRHLRRRGRAARPRPGRRGGSDDLLGLVRGARLPGPASTRCSSTARVRPRGRGARRLRGGDGLPRHPRPARARPGARAARTSGRTTARNVRRRAEPDTRRRGDDPRAARRPAPRAQRPGRRLAPPHRPGPRRHPRRRCARSAAAPPPRSPPPTSCRARIDQLREWPRARRTCTVPAPWARRAWTLRSPRQRARGPPGDVRGRGGGGRAAAGPEHPGRSATSTPSPAWPRLTTRTSAPRLVRFVDLL